MATKIKTILDPVTGDIILPRTRSDAVTMANGTSLENIRASYTATIGTTWVGVEAPYTQEVAITGILPTDYPMIFPIYSTNIETATDEQSSWNKISQGITDTNKITFYCFQEKTTVPINIQIQVVR